MTDSIVHGIAALFAGHLVQLAAFFVLRAKGSGRGPIPHWFLIVLGFGLIQLVYVIPLVILAVATARYDATAALVVGALITGGLNLLVLARIRRAGNLVP